MCLPLCRPSRVPLVAPLASLVAPRVTVLCQHSCIAISHRLSLVARLTCPSVSPSCRHSCMAPLACRRGQALVRCTRRAKNLKPPSKKNGPGISHQSSSRLSIPPLASPTWLISMQHFGPLSHPSDTWTKCAHTRKVCIYEHTLQNITSHTRLLQPKLGTEVAGPSPGSDRSPISSPPSKMGTDAVGPSRCSSEVEARLSCHPLAPSHSLSCHPLPCHPLAPSHVVL
jgi:hypothetical protein